MHAQSFVAVAAALVGSAALSHAAPLNARDAPGAAPIATIFPDTTSLYHANTGAVDFNVWRGFVSRSPNNGGADVSTLVTFSVPASYAGNKCQLVFDLNSPSSYTSGSQKAQAFTSIAPATESTETWPNGNLRNQFIGTLDIVNNGRATFEAGSGPGATTNGFIDCCDIAGKLLGGEVVPVGDSDTISWVAGVDGPKILVF